MTIKTENWLGEYTSTIGTGDITLGGAIDGFAGFSNVGENVDVYYTVMDALDKETGIGTLTGGKLVRKDIHATLVDGAYVKNGSAINLSGDAQVYGTANAHFLDYVQTVANAEIVNTQAIAELKALQINGHALTASFNLTAADVGAHPDSWMPSTEALNVYQKDASDIRYLKTQDAEQVAGLVMRVGGAREQQLQQSINDVSTAFIGDAPPAGAPVGKRWFDTESGRTYIKYNDGDSTQWIEESPQGLSPDGLESRIDEALRRSYAEAGYSLVDGSFEVGGTLVNASDVLLSEVSGRAYSGPAGAVAPGTNPVGDSDWTPRTDETLRRQLSSNSGASIVGVSSATTLADYLLKGDGIDPDMINGPLNDVGRMQAAVDLWATDRTKWIKLGRSYDLTGGTIYVSNPESYVPESQLVIFGGELKKLDAGYMFDKPLGVGQVESTGGLRFKGTRFLGPKVAGTYIINGHHDSLGLDDSTHILRVAFEGCMGVGIQAAHAKPDGYVQTITFDSNCVWRRWAGYIVDVGRLYDVQMINMRSEAGDGIVRTRDDTAPVACNGLIILGGNIEGNLGTSGPAIHVGVCWGTSISGVYMEHNQGGDIDCSRSLGYHRGLSIHGVKCEPSPAQLANPNYYPFELGRGIDGSFDLGGNMSTGNLYNCGVNNPASIMDNSSSCGAGYKKFSPNILRKVNFTSDGFEATSALGGAVGADYGNSFFYHQDPASTDPNEKAYTGAVYAAPTAISHPGVTFGKGSFLLNRGAAQEARVYGGVSRIVEVLGWKCVETGAPGVWREIVVMVPY